MRLALPSHRLTLVLGLAAVLLAGAGVLLPDAARAGSIVSLGACNPLDCTPPPPNADFVAVATGNYHGMGLKADGSIVAWGMCDVFQCDVPIPNSGWTAITAGDSHSLALRGGQIFAWGSNDAGELNLPSPNSGFVAISAGQLHNLALRADGSIVGWGRNSWGEAGPPPPPNSGFVAIAASGYTSMALRADGTIVKWGCGGPCPVPEPNEDFIAIAGHYAHSLALRSDGSIVAWGSNAFGQLDVPEPNTDFVKIAAGSHFSLGIRSDGSVASWGGYGQDTVPLPNTGFVGISANMGFANGVRATTCTGDAECDDSLYCNGDESCAGGTCQVGALPCSAPEHCNESDDSCVECVTNAHCDDGLFCSGVETCAPDGTCDAGSTPCPGIPCDEGANACMGGTEAWLSFTAATSVPGLGVVADEDIVARNVVTGAWSLVFDGSDVGLAGHAIDGMARMPNGSILLSFAAAGKVSGLAGGPSGQNVDDSDIVRFVPTSVGSNTAGSFVFHFDGSDIGLTTDDEDVDAIAVTSTGQLVISTLGPATATGASGADTDLLRFTATSLGSNTAGSFVLNFDGSDVGLTDNGNEDVDAAGITSNGKILLSTLSTFAAPGVSGADEDVFQFTPSTLGATTSGTYSAYLDLSALGIATSANVGSVELVE